MHHFVISLLKSFSFIILAAILTSCEFSSDNINDEESNFQYPVEIGNKWTYDYKQELFNFRPDSIMHIIFPQYLNIERTVEITKDTLLKNNLHSYIFEQTETAFENTYKMHCYYNNEENGFYQYANGLHGDFFALPKSLNTHQFNFAGLQFNSPLKLIEFLTEPLDPYQPGIDSIFYYEHPHNIFAYPPIEGKEWKYSDNGPLTIWKKIEGKELISTETGIFNCYKIRWIYEENDFFPTSNVEFIEYICEKGLIKKTLRIIDGSFSYTNDSEPIGYYDSITEIILTDINF